MSVVEALVAVSKSDWALGADQARRAAHADASALLPRALATFLGSRSGDDIYAEPEGFERFISGGANPALYTATIDRLRGVLSQRSPTSMLDIGCGDGRVTAAVAPPSVSDLTLVEPSEALLATAAVAVRAPGRTVRAEGSPVERFLAEATSSSWSFVQSTFALHTLGPADRQTVLRELATRASSVAIVEFDVPDFDDGSVEHARYAAERYEIGLAEYPEDELVAQRFLMPVLVGQFDPTQKRLTHEQSSERWAEDFRSAGFNSVTVTPVFPYWWAPAVLIEATSDLDRSRAVR